MSTTPHDRAVLGTGAVVGLGEVDPQRLATVRHHHRDPGGTGRRPGRRRHRFGASRSPTTPPAGRDRLRRPAALDAEAARAFGPIAASLCAAGQKPRARAFDAMIAAIAVSQALPIYTFNPRDFAATGAELVDLSEEAEHLTP